MTDAKCINVIHTADIHLGARFVSLENKSKLHRDDCQKVFSGIIDLCISHKVDALLIAGDLFDNSEPQNSLVKFVIEQFERLRDNNVNVFISSGNHDSHKEGSVWSKYEFPSNVTVFSSKNMEPRESGDMIVYGLAYMDNEKEPLNGFSVNSSDKFKIGLVHGSVVNIDWKEQSEKEYRKITDLDLDNCGLDYVALGHFHNTRCNGGKTRCYYSGSPEPLSFKNEKDCGVLLITYDGETRIDHIKTNIREFDTVEIDCTHLETDTEIRKVLIGNKGENKALRLILKGSPSLDLNIDIELLTSEYNENYFFLKIMDEIDIPADLNADDTIRGNFIRLMKSEINKEVDPKKKKVLTNAMRIGVGHLDKNV
jgi:exonuclease SbcD